MDKLIAVLIVLLGAVALSFLLSWPVMVLWNGCLVDVITGVKEVTWLQAWGLNLLAGIMFRPSAEFKPK
jgi:hypothetical protein